MSRRKVAPLLLAASVFLTGATAILTGSMTPAQAITSVEELRDIDTSHWAYQALADLVEKYDVIEGYPDYTFKGNRAATRYEMAAALNALIKAVGRDLARLGAEKANKSDLATLARLQEEFRNELAALNARTAALESRASAIEAKNAEQDNRLDLLEKTQLHGDMSFGLLADFGGNGLGAGPDDGIDTNISALGRFRLGMKVPVVPGYDNSSIGEGDVIARLVGAFGRWAPQGANDGVNATVSPISGYSALAGQASTFNEGVQPDSLSLGGSTLGLNTRQNLYVESAYYKQHFKSGIPVISDLIPGGGSDASSSSDLYVGIVPWRNLFNRSPYRGDELNQFQNTALVNNPGLLVNNINPTIAHSWHKGFGDNWGIDLTVGASSFNVSDVLDGLSITEELALNYNLGWFGGNNPGSLYVGGYHIFLDTAAALLPGVVNRDGVPIFAADDTGPGENLDAFYAGWNQEWWRGIGTSVDYVLNETGANNSLLTALRNGTGVNASLNRGGVVTGVQQAVSAVLSIPLTAFNPSATNRAKDVWGIGYSWIDPTELGTEGAGFDETSEHVVETFYRWAVNDSVSIIPSAQVIFNRFGIGENDASFVLGLRTNYVF